jgi:NADH-quinone oxidoreductase subunit J
MDVTQIVFLAISVLLLGSALLTVTSRNLVHAALWLIVVFFHIAIVFVLLNAGFLAAVQVVVYIGAISILIIFAVMLTRRVMQDTGPQITTLWPAALAVALVLFVGILVALGLPQALTPGAASLIPGFSAAAPALPTPIELGGVDYNTQTLIDLGRRLSSPDGYLLPLLLVGALLVIGMVGSINVARDDKERS